MNLSGNQWFCLLVVGIIVAGIVLISFAEALGRHTNRGDEPSPNDAHPDEPRL